MLFGEIACFLR